jgi:uncharacterized protein
MIPRLLQNPVKRAAKSFPIIGIVGPRQSGKTTLAKQLFPKYDYVNLEQLDTRRFASEDPHGFLNRFNNHVILDEIQRVPDLFSYLQVHVDNQKDNGQFILTGSQHFLMMQSITQTLAGRIGLFNLYPFSYEELNKEGVQEPDILAQILKGGYPRLYDQKVSPSLWLSSYIQTYLDRDVSLLSQIENISAFEKFVHLIAGRTGQLLNLSSLGSEAGVTHNTIKSWISLLKTSGIVFLFQPYYANISKRLNKTAKLYFIDSGLVCYLLGINTKEQLRTHPLYGFLFETFIVSEFLKFYANKGINQDLFFWRDQQGTEADIVIAQGNNMNLYEIKSAQTIASDVFAKLKMIQKTIPQESKLNLIYGGDDTQSRTKGLAIGWKSLFKHLSQLA